MCFGAGLVVKRGQLFFTIKSYFPRYINMKTFLSFVIIIIVGAILNSCTRDFINKHLR